LLGVCRAGPGASLHGRKAESQIHAPTVGLANPLRVAARTTETVFAMVLAVFFGRPDESFMHQILVSLQASRGKGDALARKTHHCAHIILLIKA
jgi:hypothetical protein